MLVEPGRPLILADLEVPPLALGQVLVEVAYCGVCHTQVLEARGHRGDDPHLPHCLGHEGSGVVRDVGGGVSKVRPGDRVILSWIKGSGADIPGTRYRWGDRTVNAGGITTFIRHAVISENRLTQIGGDVSLAEAALLGCAIPTAVGAVVNTARAQAGETVAVFGVGGIGLCAVAGAVMAGCTPVVAIDLLEEKLQLARELGATHVVNGSDHDPLAEITRICPQGLDVAIEATGRPAVMVQALAAVRRQGGRAVIIGNARHGESLQFDPHELNLGKRLLGTWGGDNDPDRDFPRYTRLLESGRLRIAPLLRNVYRLTEINAALDDLEAGRVARPLVTMEQR